MCQVFMLEISIPVWNLNSVYNGGPACTITIIQFRTGSQKYFSHHPQQHIWHPISPPWFIISIKPFGTLIYATFFRYFLKQFLLEILVCLSFEYPLAWRTLRCHKLKLTADQSMSLSGSKNCCSKSTKVSTVSDFKALASKKLFILLE